MVRAVSHVVVADKFIGLIGVCDMQSIIESSVEIYISNSCRSVQLYAKAAAADLIFLARK